MLRCLPKKKCVPGESVRAGFGGKTPGNGRKVEIRWQDSLGSN